MRQKQLTALGGDIFAGLFTYGIKQAGYEVLGHLEHTTYGSRTAKLNFPDLDIRNGVHTWNPHEFRGKVNFMYTNPPCAAWSAMQVASHWSEHTERLQIIRDLVAAGQIIKPDAWCWESVTGAWTRGREFVLEQADAWMAHGYHVTVLLQNNMYLGVPQTRQRMIMIAHRYPLVWPPLTEPPTVKEVFARIPKELQHKGELVKMPESIRQLYAETRPGGVPRHVLLTKTEEEQKRLKQLGPRPAMTVHRVAEDKVSRCFVGVRQAMHPKKARYLTWHECLALVGLPNTWQSALKPGEARSLELSRAVMPGVGRWLGQAVADGLKLKPLNKKKPVCRLVDLRNPDAPVDEVIATYVPPEVAPPVAWNPPVPQKKSNRKAQEA